jgi:tetratricopeptide (TPR) repeat protein
VSQDITTSRVGDHTVGAQTDQTDNIKRRLGAWTAPMAAQTAPMAGNATQPDATVNLVAVNGGVPTSLIPSSQMAPPIPSGQSMTVPLADNHAPPVTNGFSATRPIVDPQTVPFPQASPEPPVSTVRLPSHGQATTAMNLHGAVTGSMPPHIDSTVPLGPSGATATMPLSDELQTLRAQIRHDPNNADLVFELALALNEAGERAEANELLHRLIAIYEVQGDQEQATRIRSMVGGMGTAQIDDSAGTTHVMGRNTTESLGRRTGTLSLRTNAAQRDGRVGFGKKNEERERAVFSVREVAFLDHLPQTERLNPEAAAFYAKAEEERGRGRYRSALDQIQMTVAADPSVPAIFLRLAELQLKLGYRRQALDTINALQRNEPVLRSEIPEWVFARVRLHAEPFDLTKVKRLVDGLVSDGHGEIAAPYAARLVEHLALDGRTDEAQSYSDRICALAPGDTRAALEAVVLALRHSGRGGAIDRWEYALRNGADAIVAKASMAAIIAADNEMDHWRALGDILPIYRKSGNQLIADAYRRSAEAMGWTPLQKSAASLFYRDGSDANVRASLATAAGDRQGSAIGRAAAAGALARILETAGRGDEYLAAIRTTLGLFADQRIPAGVNWAGLLGYEPSIAVMSSELGQELTRAGDAAGAVEVLKQGHAFDKTHTGLTLALAEAYSRTNQLGSALTVLDELAMSHRKGGRLDDMASVLRQMSQLAPSNIKVKSRLVDAYLQRGFVAEARAELIQRADLEERAEKTKEAIISLQRAADLSWNLGFPQETFNLYDRILALDPEDVSNRSALVNLYLQVGRLSDAAEHQRAVVDLAIKNGRKHEAIAALHQVIGLTPDDMTAYYQLGEALSSMGEYLQAEKVYRRIVLMNPDDAVAQAKATAMAALKEQALGQ